MKSDEKKTVSMKAVVPKIHKLAQTFSAEGTIIVVFGGDKFPKGAADTEQKQSGDWQVEIG